MTAPDPTHVPMVGRLSFKRGPKATGLARIGEPHAHVDIKIAGRMVGNIVPPHWSHKDSDWRVRVNVDDPDKPGGWKSLLLVYRAKDEADARAFVTRVDQSIRAKFDLYAFPKE
jgi:hypothetical protein